MKITVVVVVVVVVEKTERNLEARSRTLPVSSSLELFLCVFPKLIEKVY